jgi:Zn-dependent alcohol dehydrogenase
VPAGSAVVVIGTGGVGLNSVQGAALAGAQPIVAVDLSNAKLETSRAFGATHTVNPTQEDTKVAVRSLTPGRGARAAERFAWPIQTKLAEATMKIRP